MPGEQKRIAENCTCLFVHLRLSWARKYVCNNSVLLFAGFFSTLGGCIPHNVGEGTYEVCASIIMLTNPRTRMLDVQSFVSFLCSDTVTDVKHIRNTAMSTASADGTGNIGRAYLTVVHVCIPCRSHRDVVGTTVAQEERWNRRTRADMPRQHR